MRYLLRANKTLAEKFERAVLASVRRDGWEMSFCLQIFLLVNAF